MQVAEGGLVGHLVISDVWYVVSGCAVCCDERVGLDGSVALHYPPRLQLLRLHHPTGPRHALDDVAEAYGGYECEDCYAYE